MNRYLEFNKILNFTSYHATHCIIVHYDEISIKGANRFIFERKLKDNIKQALSSLKCMRVRRLPGRFAIEFEDSSTQKVAMNRLKTIFGIAYLGVGIRLRDIDNKNLIEFIIEILNINSFDSFALRFMSDSSKSLFNLNELQSLLKEEIQTEFKAEFKQKNANILLTLEFIGKDVFFYTYSLPGPGGLPIGVSGRVVSLVSGGIDSPVAAYQIMKRGCNNIFVHFHSYPITSKASQDKVIEIVRKLAILQKFTLLYLIPFSEIQKEIIVDTPAPLRMILYRRMMLRIGENIALKLKAKALVTGDSLGQVSSQTLDNLVAISSCVSIPILRPLIGLDKKEIVSLAKSIKTYNISIQNSEDTCSFLITKHPVIRANIDSIIDTESKLNIKKLIIQSLISGIILKFNDTGQFQYLDPLKKVVAR